MTSAVSGVETLAWAGVPYPQAAEQLRRLWDLLLPLLIPDEALGRFRTGAPD